MNCNVTLLRQGLRQHEIDFVDVHLDMEMRQHARDYPQRGPDVPGPASRRGTGGGAAGHARVVTRARVDARGAT